jgi:ADP-ribose pyrophosphatase YjhB (NUDIX family)
MANAKWHSSAFYFTKIEGLWYSLGVIDGRFQADVKPVGGCEDTGEVSPDVTLIKEFQEETNHQLSPLEFVKVHERENRGHTKFFYLVKKVSGEITSEDELTVKEPDGEILKVRLWPLTEFEVNLFRNYREGYEKAKAEMRKFDPTFTF